MTEKSRNYRITIYLEEWMNDAGYVIIEQLLTSYQELLGKMMEKYLKMRSIQLEKIEKK